MSRIINQIDKNDYENEQKQLLLFGFLVFPNGLGFYRWKSNLLDLQIVERGLKPSFGRFFGE